MQDVLDREEVLRLFKVIFSRCRHIEGKSLKLMPPDADSVHSKGYQKKLIDMLLSAEKQKAEAQEQPEQAPEEPEDEE